MHNMLDGVRVSTAKVAAKAQLVRTREDLIADYARSLPLDKLVEPALDPSSHFVGEPDETLAFFVTLDTINFGSGYFPHLGKLPGKSGYFTIATHLTEHYRKHGVIAAEELAVIDAERCRTIFRQARDDGPIDELMSLFARALNELGQFLVEDCKCDFERLIAAADHSANHLVRILEGIPMYRDIHTYHDMPVPFYKRAQLLAADLNLALRGEGLGRFDDLNDLTIFADNLVPHVLRCDGVLEYDPELARRIDAGELIAAGSDDEIEIRAAAVYACERIARTLHPITPMQVDYLLWNQGQEPAYKARPRHRTRTWFY